MTITTEIEAGPGEQTNLDLENHSATSTLKKVLKKNLHKKALKNSNLLKKVLKPK